MYTMLSPNRRIYRVLAFVVSTLAGSCSASSLYCNTNTNATCKLAQYVTSVNDTTGEFVYDDQFHPCNQCIPDNTWSICCLATQDCVLEKNWASWKQKCTEDGHTENVGKPATVNGPFGVALLVLAGSGCTFGFYLAFRNMQRERMASGEDRTFQQRRNIQTPSQVQHEMADHRVLTEVGAPSADGVVMGIPVQPMYSGDGPPFLQQGVTYPPPVVEHITTAAELPRQNVTCPRCSTQVRCVIGTRHVICPECEHTLTISFQNPLNVQAL
mmetsp:Transcript_41737/g.69721  ORF Transcript_41737/g.69721 Transcript_41737/m.69721 type:complete len:270 (+) Transcript_41737:247-1056(+)